jgi:prepilin-type processing-associated H-X9-DG protein
LGDSQRELQHPRVKTTLSEVKGSVIRALAVRASAVLERKAMNFDCRQRLTLPEVLLAILTVGLLVMIFLPHIAREQAKASRTSCVNNLKQIGLAHRVFAQDHGDEFVFRIPREQGGSPEAVSSPQVFAHYAALSNELNSPKVLVCPTDNQRRPAASFELLRNTNISYFVALDANGERPQSLLSGDRNIEAGPLKNGFLLVLTSNSLPAWSSAMHNRAGNIGLADGSVQQVDNQRLRELISQQPLPVRLAIP